MIAINQDPLVSRARLVLQSPDDPAQAWRPGHTPNITMQVWAKPLHDGSVAVVAFNRGPTSEMVTIPWWLLRLATVRTCAVRDLWQRQPLGRFLHNVTLEVPSHDARALKVAQCFDGP